MRMQSDLNSVIDNMDNLKTSPAIVRNSQMVGKVVIVDGQPGCGKSLFSAIVASFDRVEKLTLACEIEAACALRFLQRIDDDVANTLVRLHADVAIYNLMMSREANFRPSDVSSVFCYPKPFRYFKRLFQKGNEVIPDRIMKEKPILHLCTHDLLGRAEPVFTALGTNVVFIEVVRHPLYMLKQATLNMQYLLSNPRHFDIYFEHKNRELPYFAYGWEDLFFSSNNVEKAIYLIKNMTGWSENFKRTFAKNKMCSKQIITIPFECFVKKPDSYLDVMTEALETRKTSATRRVLRKQNVPRKLYADGMKLDIYKRYGWESPMPGSNESKEFALRRAFASEHASQTTMQALDRLCTEYEEKYLGGKIDY